MGPPAALRSSRLGGVLARVGLQCPLSRHVARAQGDRALSRKVEAGPCGCYTPAFLAAAARAFPVFLCECGFGSWLTTSHRSAPGGRAPRSEGLAGPRYFLGETRQLGGRPSPGRRGGEARGLSGNPLPLGCTQESVESATRTPRRLPAGRRAQLSTVSPALLLGQASSRVSEAVVAQSTCERAPGTHSALSGPRAGPRPPPLLTEHLATSRRQRNRGLARYSACLLL